jgi:hypothetical protein
VFGAAASLFGACLLGLYLGMHDSLARPGDEPTGTAATAVSLRPGMATAIQAQPLKPDQLPASAAPTQVAQAAKPKTSDETDDQSDDETDQTTPASKRAAAPPEPPPLYSPDAPSSPPPPPPPPDSAPPF